MARGIFSLSFEDAHRLKIAISKCQGDVEDAINNSIHNRGRIKMTLAIENLIPVSKVKKRHAKYSNPLRADLYNLGVTIKTKYKFHYLYFPQNAEGTSKKNSPNDFMEDGIDKIYDNIVNDMLDSIQRKIEETL